ncbi:MAG: nucleoside phosphorylase [Bacteroidota bacterium]|nr:nucleoside phosphorylase [Bacteroidota bacterium]
MNNIFDHKHYTDESVFLPENLLREARRQKNKKECNVPAFCVLDPDGDLADYLINSNLAIKNDCWACYHSTLYSFRLDNETIGIIPCVVGSSYAVLVAEQLFVSGCELLISITSAGIIKEQSSAKKFALITNAIRDEGTSYHYLPPGHPSILNAVLLQTLHACSIKTECPFFEGSSWTTDAPYRETQRAIDDMKKQNIVCVEMEAAALYALSAAKKYNIICFAHLTNSMAQSEGDFEKGEEFGSLDSLNLIRFILQIPGLKMGR